ncbi:MFS transporter [Streptomyces sp. NBC_01304]|uniref:MFS transporter n=1 Tax=Streptomyces sp. NBC_01304 TaxID=2903818 RepID=UPI002E0D6DC4|nr:MFS transporter [Streptomyces sp. NBC_01304]
MPRRPGLVLFMVCVAIFMLMLDAMVVSAALGEIRADFDASIDGLQWVVDAYSIPLAGVLLTFATLGDRYGRKRMYVAGMLVFTAASLAMTLSGSIVQLDVLRVVQGIGAAMLFATALPLLAVAFPEAKARAKAIGTYGAVMASATVLGPVIGGALVTQFGWRSIFLINVPIGIAITVLAVMKMPETASTPDQRADWSGSLLLTGGLVAGVFALTRSHALGWTSGTVLTLIVTAVVLLIAFLVRQTRARHPLFDLSMAKKPGFAGTAIVSVAHMATLMAAATYLALFLMGALGHTPLEMGLRLLPISLCAMIAAPVTAVFARRVPLAVGTTVTMGMVTAGMYLLGNFGRDDSWTHFLPGMIVGGLGIGALTALNQAASLTFASQENAGMSSATFGTLRQVGMAMGIAGLGAIFSQVAQDKAESGLAAVPGAGAVPQDLKEQFVDQVGSGSGHQVVEAVPAQFHDAVPALTRVADNASIDALNALANLGALVGAVSVVIAAIAFAVDRGRVSRRRSASEQKQEVTQDPAQDPAPVSV